MTLTIDNAVAGLRIKYIGYQDSYDNKLAVITKVYNTYNPNAGDERSFNIAWEDGRLSWTIGWRLLQSCFDIQSKIYKKPRKIIPDIPLDPTLHILEAGYIQDRMRKRF